MCHHEVTSSRQLVNGLEYTVELDGRKSSSQHVSRVKYKTGQANSVFLSGFTAYDDLHAAGRHGEAQVFVATASECMFDWRGFLHNI